ncbi:MAG: cytochrome B [Bacteroidetes bacterium]|nr:cytochrome B [Bacteroidota bacterium]
MNNGLLHAHSGLRWVFLFFICFSLILAFTKRSAYGKREQKMALLTMILAHTQLVIGLALYFISPKVQLVSGFMKDAMYRFFGMEHFLGMLVAVVIITLGRKKALLAATPELSTKKIRLYFSIALVIILMMIPWPFRAELGGAWF